MNKDRRNRIQAIRDTIDEHHRALSAGIHDEIVDLQTEEQEAFDNLPDGLQQSEQGQRTEEAANALDGAQSTFEDAFNQLQEVLDKLDEAVDV